VLVLVALLILVLSLAPRALLHAQDLLNDKLQHLVAYLLLGMCAMLASQRRGPASLLLAVGFCTALGGLIEILQPFVGRSRDVADLVSDLVGAVVGAAAIALASRWMRSRKRRQA
jgi:VanZ family protein